MSNFVNRNLDDQIGFEQGNFGETSSVEMEDSLADDLPAESDTSMDIADVAVLDRDSNEVLCIVMENSQFACSLLGHEGNCEINTERRRHTR